MRRTGVAALAAASLIAGASGCSGDTDSGSEGKVSTTGRPTQAGAEARACENGSYSWSQVNESERLTGVSEVETLGKGGGELKNEVRRRYTPEASVRAEGPTVPSQVLFSLGKEIGFVDDLQFNGNALAGVGHKAPDLNDGTTEVHGAGAFVQYAGVRAVEADFRYSCPGGSSTHGHVKSWKNDISGVVDCAEPASSKLGIQAARLSCERGAPATTSSGER